MKKMKLFFLPGWASSPIIFEFMRPMMEAFGESVYWSWQDLIEQPKLLEEKIKAYDGPVFLIGWSLGTVMALHAAAQCSNVCGMMLFSATPKLVGCEGFPGVDPGACRAMIRFMQKNPEYVLREFATNSCFPMQGTERLIESFVRNALLMEPKALMDGLRYLEESDYREEIGQIQMPILLFHGIEDQIVPIEANRWLAVQLTKAERVEFEKAGHMILFSHSQEILAHGQQFMQRHFGRKDDHAAD